MNQKILQFHLYFQTLMMGYSHRFTSDVDFATDSEINSTEVLVSDNSTFCSVRIAIQSSFNSKAKK